MERRLRKLPLGLIGMVALILAIEARIGAGPWSSSLNWSWRSAREMADSQADRCEILLFGDSQVKVGLQPLAIEERLGVPSYNLSIPRGQTPASYYLLRQVLDRNGPTRAVLVSAMPTLLSDHPVLNADEFGLLLNPFELLELSLDARDPRILARGLMARLLPTIGAREELRMAVRTALLDRRELFEPRLTKERRQRGPNRGMVVKPGISVEQPPPASSRRDRPWVPDRTNVAYLRRFLTLASRRNLPVYWMMPTIGPMLTARREKAGHEASYRQFVQDLQRDFPNLIVLDLAPLGLSPTEFSDPLHLNGEGAARLSRAVAEALTSDPRISPRWVALRDPSPTRSIARGPDTDLR